MERGAQRIAAMGAVLLAAWPAAAQQGGLPFQLQHPQKGITTPQGRAESGSMLTTKPANDGVGLPWQPPAPVSVTAPGAQAVPQPIPFGRASSYQPVAPGGPAGVMAVPVENIDAIETSEPAPATPAAHVADPVNEDPAAPTELTAPIFAGQDTMIPRSTVLFVLNKVTARGQKLEIRPGDTAEAGKLSITARFCQNSAENSLPDAAVLLEIAERVPEEDAPVKRFAGWMYQSSPSVSALEHPVYDVTLLGCKDQHAKVEKPPETKTPAKKRR